MKRQAIAAYRALDVLISELREQPGEEETVITLHRAAADVAGVVAKCCMGSESEKWWRLQERQNGLAHDLRDA